MATQMDREQLDLEEQLAGIRQMAVNTDKAIVEIQKVQADTKVVTFATVFQGFIAIAALLGAGAAIGKLIFP